MTDDQDEVVGCTVLIGLTNYDANGQFLGQEQMFGTIKSVTENGIEVSLDDGGQYFLPPDLAALQTAQPGEYRLRQTGKVVHNPHYICTYEVTKPQKH